MIDNEVYVILETNTDGGYDIISVGFDEEIVLDELDSLEHTEDLISDAYTGRYNVFVQRYLNDNPCPDITETGNEWEKKFIIAFEEAFKSLGLPKGIKSYSLLCERLENFYKREFRYISVPAINAKKSKRLS